MRCLLLPGMGDSPPTGWSICFRQLVLMAKAGRRGPAPAHGGASQPPRPRAELAQLLAAGVRYHQAGHLKQADALYREVLRHDPDHADALHLLGQVALQTNNLPLAEGLIE